MKLEKIQSSYVVSDGDKRRHERHKSSPAKKANKKSGGICGVLNRLFESKGMPYRIFENDGKYYYTSLEGEVLGEVASSQVEELLDNIKLGRSEIERKLTYDGQAPSGNFLDLDI